MIYCEVLMAAGCNETDGIAVAKYYCNTEKKYVCEEDNKFCHARSHNWRELNEQEKGT